MIQKKMTTERRREGRDEACLGRARVLSRLFSKTMMKKKGRETEKLCFDVMI